LLIYVVVDIFCTTQYFFVEHFVMRLAKKLKSDDKVVFPECRDGAVPLVFDGIASFEVLASLAE
jgi:hypothetical protein